MSRNQIELRYTETIKEHLKNMLSTPGITEIERCYTDVFYLYIDTERLFSITSQLRRF